MHAVTLTFTRMKLQASAKTVTLSETRQKSLELEKSQECELEGLEALNRMLISAAMKEVSRHFFKTFHETFL